MVRVTVIDGSIGDRIIGVSLCGSLVAIAATIVFIACMFLEKRTISPGR
jgi:hypothetical protein